MNEGPLVLGMKRISRNSAKRQQTKLRASAEKHVSSVRLVGLQTTEKTGYPYAQLDSNEDDEPYAQGIRPVV